MKKTRCLILLLLNLILILNAAPTLTVRSATNQVPPGYAGVNLTDQILGAFIVEVQEEDVYVADMDFNVQLSKPKLDSIGDLILIDSDGNPVAALASLIGTGTNGIAKFSEGVFPIGTNLYYIVGILYYPDFVKGDNIKLSTTPSTQWHGASGFDSKTAVTPKPVSRVASSLMTLRVPEIKISLDASLKPRTVMDGSVQVIWLKLRLDTQESSEDLWPLNLPAYLHLNSADPEALEFCGFYYDDQASSTDFVLPSGSDLYEFKFSGSTVIPKATLSTIYLRCSLKSGVTNGSAYWSLVAHQGWSDWFYGAESGTQETLIGITAGNGPTLSFKKVETFSQPIITKITINSYPENDYKEAEIWVHGEPNRYQELQVTSDFKSWDSYGSTWSDDGNVVLWGPFDNLGFFRSVIY